MALSERLKNILTIKNMTEYRLAKLTNINKATINLITTGTTKNPGNDTLNKLAKGLELSTNVFNWTDEEFSDWLRYYAFKGNRTLEEYAEYVFMHTGIGVIDEFKSIEKCEMKATPLIEQLENAEDPNYVNELQGKNIIARQDNELIKKIRDHGLYEDVNNYVDFQISRIPK
jgi:transcriptional regulator with XRE-family HTH domain